MQIGPDSPYLTDASNYRGHADELFLPESEAAVIDIMRRASAAGIPVTISGGGSGLTGGRVPDGGWLLSLEKMNAIAIHPGYSVCGAGASLTSIQSAAAPSKRFYGPDPTEYSAAIGGTVATNASGSRSFMYRATRQHVGALRVVLANGEVQCVAVKNRRLKFLRFRRPMSAKTLPVTICARAWILWISLSAPRALSVSLRRWKWRCCRCPPGYSRGIVFFESDVAALDAVDAWRSVPGVRMLEYVDAAALDLIRASYPDMPSGARAAILTEQEVPGDDDVENDVEEAWLRRLEDSAALIEGSWFATSAADRERFREFRHALPEATIGLARMRGLTLVGTDFSVPLEKNREMLSFYREKLGRDFPGQSVIFGHIGDAHVHVNFLAADREQWEIAMRLMGEFARKSVELGGTVSAEHGLGKRKREYLSLQFSAEQIEAMKAIKRRLDPQWLLGRGTLFAAPAG